MKKTAIAKRIENFIIKHKLNTDVRIYFSNKCWNYDSSGNKTTIKNIKASDYFDYANDKTISMSFEGDLYSALNMECGYKLFDEFSELNFEGYYFDFGNTWNLSFYK